MNTQNNYEKMMEQSSFINKLTSSRKSTNNIFFYISKSKYKVYYLKNDTKLTDHIFYYGH